MLPLLPFLRLFLFLELPLGLAGLVVLLLLGWEAGAEALGLAADATKAVEDVEDARVLLMVSSSRRRSLRTSSKVGNGLDRFRRATMWEYRSLRPRSTLRTRV